MKLKIITRFIVFAAGLIIISLLLSCGNVGGNGDSNAVATQFVIANKAAINVGSPYTAGAGFTVTVEARDANNNVVTSYNGAGIVLDDADGTPNQTISPATIDFSNGVWSGSVVVTEATPLILRVGQGSGLTTDQTDVLIILDKDIIAITSSSQGLTSDKDGYFSGTGSIEIKNSKLFIYDYDLKYTKDESPIVYYASSGHSDYTSTDPLSGFFNDILTNKHYRESVSNTSPVVAPGITPSTSNLVEDIAYDWLGGLINTITGSDWASGIQQLPEWKVEYSYDGSNRLTKICEGERDGTTITRYYDVSFFSSYDPKGFPQTEKYYHSDIENLTNNPGDRPESISITCGPGSSLGGTWGKYFLLYSNTTEYYVWYNTGSQGDPSLTVPELSGKTGIQVSIGFGDTADQVAVATATEIKNMADFTALNPGANFVNVTTVSDGGVTDPADGDTLFTISFDTQGYPTATTNYEYTYGSRETPDTITMNSQTRQEYIYDASGNVEKINFYENVTGWVFTGTLTFTIPAGLILDFDDISPFRNPVGSEIISTLLPF